MGDEKPTGGIEAMIEAGTIGENKMGKRLLDPDTVKQLKEMGVPKPPNVDSESWSQLQEVKVGVHTAVAHMAASGVRPKEIAVSLGLAESTVRGYLKSEKMKLEVKTLQHRMFGRDPSGRFRNLVNDATTVLEDTMRDETVKPSVRIMAADKVLDRALGKPKQHLAVESTSLIRRIYENLGGGKDEVIDVESQESREVREIGPTNADNPNTVEKIDHSENPNLSTKWSDWANKNLNAEKK